MQYKVVIDMQNPNALIAMAHVSTNANNPYMVFCEYVKYCIFVNASDTMTLSEIREAVSKEFGLYLPHNIALKCLSLVEQEGAISCTQHQIHRKGSFDTESFDRNRSEYRTIENAVLDALIKYVAQYGKVWTMDYAREQLIRVLDKNGLAYDIFLHRHPSQCSDSLPDTGISEMEEMLPDDEEAEAEDEATQPLFTDSFFVGKFIEDLLAGDTVQRDYLQKICEGLMICVGAYQLPSADTNASFPQISGTTFFFDTRLLLRFVGCAGDAAVAASRELVKLIQDAGGSICYFPHTMEEMQRAFDDAIYSLTNGYTPRDEEMRLYAASIRNNSAVLSVKKANLQGELSNAKIWLRQLESYSDNDRIRFGFDRNDLQQYMRRNLSWEQRTIENDAMSIWETHMRRQGDYREYCGTQDRLCVFVTNNSRLIAIALGYREERPYTTGIAGWKQNRLPVITDMRLTCRLWTPSTQSERLSLLYLSANAVAAQRPTRRYINSIRELAIQLKKQAPEYSGICLPEYFDDNVTDAILQNTLGQEEKLDIGTLASTIAELTEWKAKEQEDLTHKAQSERDKVAGDYNAQTASIIDGAVDEYSNKLGLLGILLNIALNWAAVVTILFVGISTGISLLIDSWHPLWIVAIPMLLGMIEVVTSSHFVEKRIMKWLLPQVEQRFTQKIEKTLRKAELPYKAEIIKGAIDRNALLSKCKDIINQ